MYDPYGRRHVKKMYERSCKGMVTVAEAVEGVEATVGGCLGPKASV